MGLQSFRTDLLQHGLSTGSSSSGNINLPWTGILHILQCEYLLWCDPLHELQGITKSLMISSKTHRLQENTSYSFFWSAFFSFADLGVFRILSHTFFLILQKSAQYFPFLKYAFTEVLPASLMGSAMFRCESVGISRNCLCPERGSPRLSTETTTVATLLPSPCHLSQVFVSVRHLLLR